ncbi:MAG: hypothetical protein NVS4B12_10350 [Ktedonobacteraceae bacterium]
MARKDSVCTQRISSVNNTLYGRRKGVRLVQFKAKQRDRKGLSPLHVQQWEGVLEDRVFDAVQYLRIIIDRACERAFGYAPFLTKQ